MSLVPTTLKGKEFEALLVEAAAREERAGNLTMGRYGTTAVIMKDESDPTGQRTKTVLVPSLPDFEGVLWTGCQFIIEAKACADPSFEIRQDKIKAKQVEHMLKRDRFGVPCCLVIFFCERIGQNFHHPAITVAIPVTNKFSGWQKFVDAVALAKKLKQKRHAPQGSISRDVAQDMGQLVPWTCPKGFQKPLPDLMSFIGGIRKPDPLPDQPTLF